MWTSFVEKKTKGRSVISVYAHLTLHVHCKIHYPHLPLVSFTPLMLALLASSSLTISMCPWALEQWRGVKPDESEELTT